MNPNSVAVRWRHEGRCECGTIVEGNYKPECTHWTECDLGRFGPNPGCDPRKPFDELMITTADYAEALLESGPQESPLGVGVHSITKIGDAMYAHTIYEGQITTYKLHEAHWEDGHDEKLYVGQLVK
jgi:hypothetical protein